MSWKAKEIEAALESALEEYAIAEESVQIRIEEPAEERPSESFTVHTKRAGRWTRAELPVGLVNGYLADEEAAVDEFKRWVDAWIRSWMGRSGGGG